MLTRGDLELMHVDMTQQAFELYKKKSADYNGTGPFDNFFAAERLGIVGAERGVLSRMMDKISRISTLLDRDPAVVGESLDDSLIDIINYAVIIRGIRLEKCSNQVK